jgi:hypothetical protein
MSTNREVEGGFRTAPPEQYRQEEDAMLIAAGFKTVDPRNGRLWVKEDGIYYGREAALQAVNRKQQEGGA